MSESSDQCPCRYALFVGALVVVVLATTGTAAAPTSSGVPEHRLAGASDAETQVVADCEVGERYPEPGEPVFIDASGSEEADDYMYDRDSEGSYDTDWIPDSTYSFTYDDGTYTPRVAVRNNTQETGNIDVTSCPTLEVAPNEPPTASVVTDPTTPKVGQAVTIDATGSGDVDGNVTTYQFDFGADGDYEIQENTTGTVTRTYETPGVKTVRVRVIDNDGATDTATIEFDVVENRRPEATLSISPSPTTTTATNTTLNASGSSDPDGTIEFYRWDFDGDGTTDLNTTEAVITRQFEYDGGGFRNVLVTVVDDDGATDVAGLDLEVLPEPEVSCTVSPDTIEQGGSVTVDASNTTHADVYIYDFDGDGEPDTDAISQSVVDSGEYPTEFYDEVTTYTPRVTAINYTSDTRSTAPCETVTVEGANEPPTASFTVSPRPAVAGEDTTFDATGSSDPDGTVEFYLWDFDGDGTTDLNTTEPTVTRTLRYEGSGFRNVRLTVVDDEGATATTTRDLELIQPEVTARCTVSPSNVTVGESFTIDASESSNAESFVYDIDGDGEPDTDRIGESAISPQAEEQTTYRPLVRVYGSGDRTDIAVCGEVVVVEEGGGEEEEDGNTPPTAELGNDPQTPTAGESVTLDASDSFDTDGTIVRYRWDLDGDGNYERTTSGPTITHTFDSPGDRTVGVQVVDDAGATASTQLRVAVEDPAGGSGLPLPLRRWGIVGLVGGGAGYLACRGRGKGWGYRHLPKPWGGGGDDSGVTGQAAGTFDTPPTGGAIAVDGLGFEPDVVRFRVTNSTRATGSRTVSRSAGWSYGVAAKTGGGLEQHAVSVADDAGSATGTAGAVNQGKAIDVLVHGEDRVGSVAGTVTKTTEDGFEVSFDTSAVPADAADESYVVLFDAFSTASDTDVDIGHVTTPTESSTETIDLDVDADFVSLVGSTLPDTANAAGVTDRSVGLSTGRATARGVTTGAVEQTASGYVASASLDWPEAAGVFDDRALALAYAGPDGVVGRTHARVTGLGEQLELTYDRVYTPEAGQEGWVVPGVVTYLAIDTDGATPATGVVQPPVDGGVTSVDVGFHPGRVELSTFEHAGFGSEALRPAGAAAFEWSESTVAPSGGGDLVAYLLHASVDNGLPLVEALAPPEPPSTESPPGTDGVTDAVGDPLRGTARGSTLDRDPDVGTTRGSTRDARDGSGRTRRDGSGRASSEGPDLDGDAFQVRAGIALREDPGGGLAGRTDVAVTALTPTGMELRVTASGGPTDGRPLVTYVAWPDPDGESDE